MPTADEIAAERIEWLAVRAREAARADRTERARRYVRLARRIAQRHRLSPPPAVVRPTCDACNRHLIPARHARVRTRDGHVVVTCECGAQQRYPYD
jgi:ribonuclease P protein subunit RPR2